MRCNVCNNLTKVIESRRTLSGVRRRRECRVCGVRTTTYERPIVLAARGKEEEPRQ